MKTLLTTAIAATLACHLPAQLAVPRNDPLWPGGGHRLDVQAVVEQHLGLGHDACLGCARDNQGHYFVTVAGAGGGQHQLVELTALGTFVAAWPQPAAAQGSVFGLRDLAYDGAGTLWGGAELAVTGYRVFAFDIPTRSWTTTAPWPLAATSSITTARGLAYRPAGAGGLGTLLVADWNSGIFEFDRSGAQVRHVFPHGVPPDVFGLAVDPAEDMVWMFHQVPQLLNPCREFVQAHATAISLQAPGEALAYFLGDAASPSLDGIAGGAEFHLENGEPTLLLLTQAASDTLSKVGGRWSQGGSCGGTLSFLGRFALGNTCLQLRLTQDPGNWGLLAVDFAGAAVPLTAAPFVGGCVLRLANPVSLLLQPLQSGYSVVTPVLPNQPSLRGLAPHWQWATIDTATLTAFTSTAGAAVIQ